MSPKTGTKTDRKIPEKVICFKCKKSVDIKKTASCSICNNRYELDCDGFPEHTYRLMDQESKKNWRCKTCRKNTKVLMTSRVSNITTRKRKNQHLKSSSPRKGDNIQESKQPAATRSAEKSGSDILDSHILSEYETSDESYNTPNKLSHSVDGTISETLTVLEMKDTIKDLTHKLESTENELENTILENNTLYEQLNKLTAENKILKSLCNSSSVIGNSPDIKHKRKRESLLQQNVFTTPCTPLGNNSKVNCGNSIEIMHLQQKIADLQQELIEAQQQIVALTKTIHKVKQDNSITKQSSVSKIYIPTPSHTKEQNHESTNRVLIFGSQQCVGLAAAMLHSRQNTKYEKYSIIANTKPGALSSQIIMSCRHAKLNYNDKIVICVGENDHNLKYTLSQLQIVLDTFYNNMIIVLNVFKNEYLDVSKLNYLIKNVCFNYKKCKFLESQTQKMSELCTKINYLIDCHDYNENYLNPRELVKRIASNRPTLRINTNINEPKKGTIPFYFGRRILKLQETDNVLNSTDKAAKGTIPYYFPVINKDVTFFRAQDSDI